MKIFLGYLASRLDDEVLAFVQERASRGDEVRVAAPRLSVELRNALAKSGATRFVSNDPFAADHAGTDHIAAARWMDEFIVWGADAAWIARAAAGEAGDFILLQMLATTAPLRLRLDVPPPILAHPAVQTNLRLLRERGAVTF